MILAQRAAADREILCECEHESAFDLPVSRNYTVTRQVFARHIEIGAPVLYESIYLNEAVFVKKDIKPFSGCELSF